MHQRSLIIVASVLFLCGLETSALARGQKKLAEGLIKRADDLSNIRAEGSPGFRLEAEVRLFAGDVTTQGHYVTDWQSPHQWRDELTFPGYHQIRGGTATGFWRTQDPPHQSRQAARFLQSLLVSGPPPAFDSKRIRASLSKHGRAQMNCVVLDYQDGMKDTREKCFDPVSGLLFSEASNDWDTVWEYTDYAPWNGKIFPRLVRTFVGGKLIAESQVTKLEADPNFVPSVLPPPKNAQEWTYCGELKPPNKLFQDESTMDYSHWIYRTPTSIFLEINPDGHVGDAVVVYPPTETEAAGQLLLDKLKRAWKFRPARCGKVPISIWMTYDIAAGVGIIR